MIRARAGGGLSLIGYRGTGKTTVGRALAERLGLPFVDLDDEVERRAGRAIAAIFEESGEAAFRDLESQAIREQTDGPPRLLATGGGAVLRPENRERLRRFGLVVWLTATPEALRLRLERQPGQRPALTPAGTLDEIATVLAAREPLYRATADLAIATTDASPTEVVGQIAAAWAAFRNPTADAPVRP